MVLAALVLVVTWAEGDGAAPARGRFAALAEGPGGGLQALDDSGRVLWERPDETGKLVPARLEPGGPVRLAGVIHPIGGPKARRQDELSILDAENGTLLDVWSLPGAPENDYPSFTAHFFVAQVIADDLDGDGGDEILVTFIHKYWPSYTVLVEPRLRRRRYVLVASGHHRLAATPDLDGDGSKELVFVGIANRMGWLTSVAAVAPSPPVNHWSERTDSRSIARTPDRWDRGFDTGSLQWIALLPRSLGHGDPTRLVAIDTVRRRLRLDRRDGLSIELGFDGFLTEPASNLLPEVRHRHRREAYWHLIEAEHLRLQRRPGAALLAVEQAVVAARAAVDPYLEEWTRRIQGRLLAAAGRVDAAEAVFEALCGTSPEAPEIAFDAGQALFLAGAPERALSWYRRGLGRGNLGGSGRSNYEYLRGIALASAASGRHARGHALLQELRSSETDLQGFIALNQDFLHWRAGDPPSDGPTWTPDFFAPDVERAWWLELRREAGEDPGELLVDVEREVVLTSEALPLVLALRAELLLQLGRHDEARRAIREAHGLAAAEALDNTAVYEALGSIAERRRRIAGRSESTLPG